MSAGDALSCPRATRLEFLTEYMAWNSRYISSMCGQRPRTVARSPPLPVSHSANNIWTVGLEIGKFVMCTDFSVLGACGNSPFYGGVAFIMLSMECSVSVIVNVCLMDGWMFPNFGLILSRMILKK
jgi:hypothetical protein